MHITVSVHTFDFCKASLVYIKVRGCENLISKKAFAPPRKYVQDYFSQICLDKV